MHVNVCWIATKKHVFTPTCIGGFDKGMRGRYWQWVRTTAPIKHSLKQDQGLLSALAASGKNKPGRARNPVDHWANECVSVLIQCVYVKQSSVCVCVCVCVCVGVVVGGGLLPWGQ